MVDRIEHAQTGVGTVARHQHHLDPGLAQAGIEVEQLLHQGEGIARLEDFVFVFDLILPVRLDATGQIDLMAVTQVEQRPRRNRQHQSVVYPVCHAYSPLAERLSRYARR
ncbi:hypothetical protein D3C80_1673680 [compost metagenome]